MGFSISATVAIIGVSLIMILEVSLGTMIPVFTDINESYDEMKQRTINQIQTEIEIQNITVYANNSLHDLSILVKNTGSTVIEKSYVNILINGSLYSFDCTKNYWFPEGTYSLSIYGVPGSGSKKIKLISTNGISDYATYSII